MMPMHLARETMLDLYNPLRSYRNDRKLSVQDLADVIDVSRTMMVAVEDGRRTITLAQRDALAKRLRVEPAKLQYLVDVTSG
jgi:DNA-binding XRE family transcriptional regulator